jgi:hypothetical protein
MHAQQLVKPLAHVRTDRIVEIEVVIGQHVLDVDGIETRHPCFFDYGNEVEARFLNQHAELARATLAERERQQVQITGSVEALGEKVRHGERPFRRFARQFYT